MFANMFNRDKKQEKTIRQGVTENSSLVAQRSAELRNEIPAEMDHPILNAVKDAGSKYVLQPLLSLYSITS